MYRLVKEFIMSKIIIFFRGDNKVGYDGRYYYIDYNNGYAREYPIYYGNKKFAYDFPERIPKYLKNAYEKYIIAHDPKLN